MRRALFTMMLGLALAAASFGGAAPGAESSSSMEGFSPAAAAVEAELERSFDAAISPTDMRAWMQELTAAPNHVGSAHDKANAEHIEQWLRASGWEASIETFVVLYPTPRSELLELVAPRRYTAKLREPAVDGDATSVQTRDELPSYNVYGADGDVRGELVYANQGMPDDYAELEREGVSVKGRIVLTRYGGGWRGLKPKLAYEHGAIGCLIYSDPRDDGYGSGDVYPKGGYRPRDGVQRGSVQDLTFYTGDPLTPGIGSTRDAKRLAIKDAPTILKIPVLPISYADAEPLLAALEGRVAPSAWRGGLPLTYHVGPGPAIVHLKIVSDWSSKPVYDVIARMPGTQEPDHWVVRGNHHDAWVFGAADPMSGQVALLAEAEAIGKLAKAGFKPRRTLIYASWDGEEPGLLGSTEWVETHADELKAKAVLYVNSDMNQRGELMAGGSHALAHFVSEAARDVKDPETGVVVLTRALALKRVTEAEDPRNDASGTEAKLPERGDDLTLVALGSGSDYTPFLQHLGVSSIDLAFRGEAQYGVYHSAYDSFDHFRRFVDPDFQYAAALAKLAGRLMLRAAQADLLPARERDFADSIGSYVEELHKLADAMRKKTRIVSELAEDGAYRLASDPTQPRSPPARLAEVPHLDFTALDNATDRLKGAARAFDGAYTQAVAADGADGTAARARLNAVLAGIEQKLTDPRGLPGRSWYQHMIYAPGMSTGYGVKTLPGIREAIEERRWDEANQYAGVVARTLDAYSAELERALASPH